MVPGSCGIYARPKPHGGEMMRHRVLTVVALAPAALAMAGVKSRVILRVGQHRGHPGDLRGRLFRGMAHT
jgi:hypothetical protein